MGLDDVVEGVAGGTAWGFGVALVAGTVLLIGKGGRPLAKRALKSYLLLSQRARELSAEATEQIQDIYAEARAEVEESNGHKPVDAPAARQEAATRKKAEA